MNGADGRVRPHGWRGPNDRFCLANLLGKFAWEL